ncbi:hypothetical protein C0Z20_11110 [Trinickia symbiotica]|uniref:Uncharacterized protein n=1 Tax=Trinickia symbiotica TaxID=863227 RepID=A0A2N7X4G3_9BURK|nr:hypothetical protein C0Z20_11110 [Trinickia symbiotica]
MFKRALFIVLLTLPGSFVVLGVACVHPWVRRELVQLAGISGPLERVASVCAAAKRWTRADGDSRA